MFKFDYYDILMHGNPFLAINDDHNPFLMKQPVIQLKRKLCGKEKLVRCVNILILTMCHMKFTNESKTSNCTICSKKISF